LQHLIFKIDSTGEEGLEPTPLGRCWVKFGSEMESKMVEKSYGIVTISPREIGMIPSVKIV